MLQFHTPLQCELISVLAEDNRLVEAECWLVDRPNLLDDDDYKKSHTNRSESYTINGQQRRLERRESIILQTIIFLFEL